MNRLLIVPLHLVLAGLFHVLTGATAAAQEAPAKLAELLDGSGQLAVPEGFSGQVDASGYRLTTGGDGSPRLISDADWGNEFGLDRGCDGIVLSAAVGDAGEIYFGGGFNYCDEIRANHIVRYDPAAGTWLPVGDMGNGTNGSVMALAFADGVLYAGGAFTEVDGGVPANRIAAWDTQSGQWRSLGQGTNGLVYSLVVSPQGDLYVGGNFTEVNDGTPRTAHSIARWNLATEGWAALAGAGGEGVDGMVNALSWMNGDLYVGGQFAEVNLGAPLWAPNLAIWNSVGGWSALGSQSNNGVAGAVRSLAVDGGDLYVGGNFGGVYQPDGSQIEARGIARWTPALMSWTVLGNPSEGPLESSGETVRAIAVIGGQLYIGGSFYGLTHPLRMRSLARWDLDAEVWSSMDGLAGSGASGDVFVLVAGDAGLYVGGNYRQARAQGDVVIPGSVSRWDVALGTVSTVGSATGAAVHNEVSAIAFLDGDMYVGGAHTVGGQSASGIARWDGQDWDLLEMEGSWPIGVSSLAVLDGELYVGGSFNRILSSQAYGATNKVARWNPVDRSWSALGDTQGNGVDLHVEALAVFDGKLIVAGYFEFAHHDGSNYGAGVPAHNIASWDPQLQQWSALGTGAGQGVNNMVYALHVKDGFLYVGGLFNQANRGASIQVNRIARWDGSNWSALGTEGGIGVDATVMAITSSATHLYVAGSLTQANVGAPVATNGVARWDLSAGGWSGLGNGIIRDPGDYVLAVAAVDGGIYVAGRFDEVNTPDSVAVRNIARWDEASEEWSSPGSGIVGSWVNDLVVHGDRVYVGGRFRMAGEQSSIGVAHFSALTRVFADGFE